MKKIKHLEMIQAIISRMSSSLFYLRGWSITLVAGLAAFFTTKTDQEYILVIYFPVLIFWLLDGYFLSQERKFRDLYNFVRTRKEREIDFSMNIKDLPEKFKNERANFWPSLFSPTILIFYAPLLILMIIITILKFA